MNQNLSLFPADENRDLTALAFIRAGRGSRRGRPRRTVSGDPILLHALGGYLALRRRGVPCRHLWVRGPLSTFALKSLIELADMLFGPGPIGLGGEFNFFNPVGQRV